MLASNTTGSESAGPTGHNTHPNIPPNSVDHMPGPHSLLYTLWAKDYNDTCCNYRDHHLDTWKQCTTTSLDYSYSPPCSLPMNGADIHQIPSSTREGCATWDSFAEWHTSKVSWLERPLEAYAFDVKFAGVTGLAVLVMRCKYTLLVAAMKRRFTPIQMTAVQAQLFHNRQQQEKGTMDQFSKTYIQKLYNLAYAGLSNQQSRTFWRIGLWTWPDHKLKFIHTGWGALEERFKEAKTQKLVGNWQRTSAPSNSITPILWTTLYPIDNLYSEQFTHWSKKRGQNKVLRLQYGWSYSKKLPVL